MKSASDCLHGSRGVMAKLLSRSEQLTQINRVFRAYLPHHLRDHAEIIATGRETWIVQTESAAWATRLRYELPNLRQQLADHLSIPAPTLKLRVRSKPQPPVESPKRRLALAEDTAKLIAAAAREIGDNGLGQALRRLAGNASPDDRSAKARSPLKSESK